jgi:hypothetical protein
VVVVVEVVVVVVVGFASLHLFGDAVNTLSFHRQQQLCPSLVTLISPFAKENCWQIPKHTAVVVVVVVVVVELVDIGVGFASLHLFGVAVNTLSFHRQQQL